MFERFLYFVFTCLIPDPEYPVRVRGLAFSCLEQGGHYNQQDYAMLMHSHSLYV